MNIKFGYNKSPKNTLNKTIEYDSTSEKTGYLKDETSITDPVIMVNGTSHWFSAYNYLEIPSFKRKYFITGITSVRKGLVAISCHCDVLSSVADKVNNQYCIVETSQNYYNTLLNDGSFKTYQDRYVINDFEFTGSFQAPGDYVLALAGS